MFEFETTFTVNTGSLNQVYTGSGVHLNKDVTFSLTLLDPQLNLISTDYDLINNPLIDSVSFDILNSGGNVVFPNYKSGSTSRSITLTEVDNASIFGSYNKDFGIRSIVTNKINNNRFTGEMYVYGNVPEIDLDATIVYDGSGSGISTGSGSESGTQDAAVLNEIRVEIGLQNSLQYIEMTKYDIYYSLNDDIVVYSDQNLNPSSNPYFLYSQNIEAVEEIRTLNIKPIGLAYNTEYYFTVVPYSNFGSGTHIEFGPAIFAKESDDNVPFVLSANQFELVNGEYPVNLATFTGITSGSEVTNNLIDTLETGFFNTVLYTVQVKTGDSYISSELKLVFGGAEGPSLLESPITNSGQLTYSIDPIPVTSGCYLYVSGAPSNSTYKVYKTSL